MVKCEKCLYYDMVTEQPDYIVDGKEVNICKVYEDGIPADIWNEKTMCSEFTEPII